MKKVLHKIDFNPPINEGVEKRTIETIQTGAANRLKISGMLAVLLAFVFLLAGNGVWGQDFSAKKGDKTFGQLNEKSLSVQNIMLSEALQIKDNESVFENLRNEVTDHPEYGKHVSKAGGIELVEQRSSHSTVYNNPDGSFTKVQSNMPLHYQKNGLWFSYINEVKKSRDGFYGIETSDLPIMVNVKTGKTTMQLDEKGRGIRFGTASLIKVFDAGAKLVETETIQTACKYSINDKTIVLKEAWNNIDRRQKINYWDVKTDYIIHTSPGNLTVGGELVFVEYVHIPENWTIEKGSGEETHSGWMGELYLKDEQNNVKATFHLPVFYDSNVERKYIDQVIRGSYRFEVNNNILELSVIVPNDWLLDENRVYPVTIDPTVSNSTSTIANVQQTNFGCSYTLAVNVPSGTITGYYSTYNILARNGAWMSEQRSRIGVYNYQATLSGVGNAAGTYSYSTPTYSEVNGSWGGGNMTFYWQAHSTWGSDYGCSDYYHYRTGNWTVWVDYTTGLTCDYTVPYSGNNTITASSGFICDHAGWGTNYSNGANGYTVINPAVSGSNVRLTFTHINMECCCDFIRIYDGVGTGGTLLGSYNCNTLPPVQTATNGPLTIQFTSDGSVVGQGFRAEISNVIAAYDPCTSIPNIPGTGSGNSATANMNGTGAWNPISNNCGYNTPGQERIFSFTPTVSGVHTLVITALTGGWTDFFWKAASGGCNNSGWNCIGDFSGTGSSTGVVQMNWTAGIQYYILVDPEGTGSYTSTFHFEAPCSPPPNNDCANATHTNLVDGVTSTLTGTGFCSTPSLGTYKDVWVSFTVPCSGMNVRLDFCSSSPVHNNAYINVFTDCSWGTFYGASSWDFTTCSDGNITLFWSGLAAGTYYYAILIDAAWETDYTVNLLGTCPCTTPTDPISSGPATICNGQSANISATSTNATTIYWYTGSCGGTEIGTSLPGANFSVSPTTTTTYYARGYNSASGGCWSTGCGTVTITVNQPPANDNCSNATNIASLPFTSAIVNNTCATDDYTTSTCDGPYKNVWWTVTGICGTMTANTCTGNTNFDSEIAVFTGGCGSLTEVVCNDDFCGLQSSVTWESSEGTVYYISVGSYYSGGSTGNIELNVTSVQYTYSVAPTGAAGTTNICIGESTALTVSGGTAGTGAITEWFTGSCGGTPAGIGNEITVSPTTTTTYYVRYNGTCNVTSCASVTVTVNPSPSITGQPANSGVTYGNPASFTVTAANETTYQWEEFTTSWAPLSNGGIYSGVNTATLQISLPTVAMNGYNYRCVVSGNCSPAATSDGNATLTVTPKSLSVTANPGQSKYFGQSDPVFTYSATGFISGENESVLSGALSRNSGEPVGFYPITIGSLTAANYSFSFTSNDFEIKPAYVMEISAFLQGNYIGSGQMNTTLRDAGQLPTNQPFNTPPWNYSGSETLPMPLPADLVDWVLVELRSNENTTLEKKAGFLLSDGKVRVSFSGSSAGGDYVVVWHRNHMPVMSASKVNLPISGASYNLAAFANLYGTNPAIDLGGGIYGMIAGDVTHNGVLQYSGPGNDRGAIIARIADIVGPGATTNSTVTGGYWFEDANMNNELRYIGANDDRSVIYANLGTLTGIYQTNSLYYSEVPGFGSKVKGTSGGPFDIYLAEYNENIVIELVTSELVVNGLVDNIQFTLAWKAADTEIADLLNDYTSSYFLVPQGEAHEVNGVMHRVYVSVTPVELPGIFNTGEMATVMSFGNNTGSSLTGRLWIADNAFTADNNAMYYVSVWGNDFTGMISGLATGLEAITPGQTVKLYPNPVLEGSVNLALNLTSEQHITVRITDIQGKTWSTVKLLVNAGISVNPLSLDGLSTGVYFVRITGDNLNAVEKLIIK